MAMTAEPASAVTPPQVSTLNYPLIVHVTAFTDYRQRAPGSVSVGGSGASLGAPLPGGTPTSATPLTCCPAARARAPARAPASRQAAPALVGKISTAGPGITWVDSNTCTRTPNWRQRLGRRRLHHDIGGERSPVAKPMLTTALPAWSGLAWLALKPPLHWARLGTTRPVAAPLSLWRDAKSSESVDVDAGWPGAWRRLLLWPAKSRWLVLLPWPVACPCLPMASVAVRGGEDHAAGWFGTGFGDDGRWGRRPYLLVDAGGGARGRCGGSGEQVRC